MVMTPAVARWIIRSKLRKAREAQCLTQRDVTEALDWSLSKMLRIEAGDVSCSTTDLQALLRLYGIIGDDQAHSLLNLAPIARRRTRTRRSAEPANPDRLEDELTQFEAAATVIRCYHPGWVPGPLQTDRYAAAVLDRSIRDLTEEQLSAHLTVARRRRESFLGRSPRPQCLVVIDEAVLRRQIGGPAVMREQLSTLLDHVGDGVVHLAVVEWSRPHHFLTEPFVVVDVHRAGSVLFRETLTGLMVTADEPVLACRDRFDKMMHTATDPGRTELLLRRSLHKIPSAISDSA